MTAALGPQIQSFVEEHLITVKRLKPASIRSYRDVLRLFLTFVAGDAKRRITGLTVSDLTFDRSQRFLRYIEESRGNHARTLNHRLAVLRTFFEYLAAGNPQLLQASQDVAAIPVKRGIPPRLSHIDREEIAALFRNLPGDGRHALRDGALVLFFYNTGAGVQEVADVRVGQLDLGAQPKVEFNGRGHLRRVCPLWSLTARSLEKLLEVEGCRERSQPVFCSKGGAPLTRFGIYKIVRRQAGILEMVDSGRRPVRPQVFRGAAPDRLDPNTEAAIRNWLNLAGNEAQGRALGIAPKDAGIRAWDPGSDSNGRSDGGAPWKDDRSLLEWLNSL